MKNSNNKNAKTDTTILILNKRDCNTKTGKGKNKGIR